MVTDAVGATYDPSEWSDQLRMVRRQLEREARERESSVKREKKEPSSSVRREQVYVSPLASLGTSIDKTCAEIQQEYFSERETNFEVRAETFLKMHALAR